MFRVSPETQVQNSSSFLRSPLSFTMGPLTIHPFLFFLPLLFWISPISSTTTDKRSLDYLKATARESDKDNRLHPGYTQTPTNSEELELTTQDYQPDQPQRDRFFMSSPYFSQPPSPPGFFFNQPQMFNYPNYSPYSFPPSPYSNSPYQSSPYQNYQSVLYDPYMMMMMQHNQPPQPSKFQSQLLTPTSSISPLLSQSPHSLFHSVQPSNHPFYSQHQNNHQSKLPQYHDIQQLFSTLQNDPQSLISSYNNPENTHTIYNQQNSDSPPTTQSIMSQGSNQQLQASFQTPSSPIPPSQLSSMYSTLSPDTQQLLSSISGNPPFGYIDKQFRNPNEDPSDIAKNPPPKAIMTTASDILGLRAHQTRPQFNFQYTPDSSKQTLHKYVNKQGQSQYKRKPPTFSFNNINNNKQLNFDNRNNPLGFDLPYTKKLKSFNTTEDPEQLQKQTPEKTYISEPIIENSPTQIPSWDDIDAVLQKSKKESKQPHNIATDEDSSPTDTHNKHNEDPIPLFITGEEDDLYTPFSSDEDSSLPHLSNSKIYTCPTSRALLDQAEVFADPIKCDQFYYCKWGRAYVFRCPVNHYFNTYMKACDVDEDYACAMTLRK